VEADLLQAENFRVLDEAAWWHGVSLLWAITKVTISTSMVVMFISVCKWTEITVLRPLGRSSEVGSAKWC
jgi:hypothetical protein